LVLDRQRKADADDQEDGDEGNRYNQLEIRDVLRIE